MATYSSGESSGSGSMLSQSSDCSTNITESLSFETQRTPAIIKPDVLKDERQRIIELIKQAGFSITRFEKILLSRNQAESLYCQHEGKDFYDILINWITSAKVDALILEKENAVEDWKEWIGPSDPISARKINPGCIRAAFGRYGIENAVHGSSNINQAQLEIDIVFGPCMDKEQNDHQERYIDEHTTNQEIFPSNYKTEDSSEEKQPEVTYDRTTHISTIVNAQVNPDLMVNALTERSESSQSENSHTETINTTVPNHTKDKKLPRHIPETSNTRDHILADTGCYPKKTKKKNNISEELLIRLTTPTISTANKMANPLHPTSLAKRKQLSSLLYNNSKP